MAMHRYNTAEQAGASAIFTVLGIALVVFTLTCKVRQDASAIVVFVCRSTFLVVGMLILWQGLRGCFWRNFVTVNLERQTLTIATGPMFPIFRKTVSLQEYNMFALQEREECSMFSRRTVLIITLSSSAGRQLSLSGTANRYMVSNILSDLRGVPGVLDIGLGKGSGVV